MKCRASATTSASFASASAACSWSGCRSWRSAALLALGLPDIYSSSGLIEIEGAENVSQSPANATLQDSIARQSDEPLYADQYVQSLSTEVLSDKNLSQLLAKQQLYEDQVEDPEGRVKRLRKDIDVDMVTVPILDPESGREREVVTAFTVSYDNRDPQRAYQGAAWLTQRLPREQPAGPSQLRVRAPRSSSPPRPSACASASASWKASWRSSRRRTSASCPS